MESVDIQSGKRAFEKQYLLWAVLVAPVFAVVAGVFLQKFTLLAGIPKHYIGLAVGLMSLLPPCASFFFTALIERKGLKSRVFAIAYTFRFALVAVLALLPSFLGPTHIGPISVAYVVVMVLIALCYTFGNLCQESLIKESVPSYRFGQFAAKVSAYSSLASLLPGLAGAYWVDRVHGLLPIQILLVSAGLIGAALTLPFVRMKGFAATRESREVSLLTPLKDRVYRNYVLLIAVQSFFVVGCTSFWGFFMLEELRLSLFAMVLIGTCCGLFSPVFAWIWGVVTDHFGPRAAFIYASFFTWASCLLLVVPVPPLLCAVFVCFLVGFYGTGGFFSSGCALAGTALRNAMMPAEQSTTYIGLYQLITGVVGFFSGVAAGLVLKIMGPLSVGGLSAYRWLFLVGNVLFGCLTTGLLLSLRERYSNPVDLKKLGLALINPTVFKDFYDIAMVNSSDTPGALEKTVKRLATRSTYLGRTELLRNFNSASVRIRRQAVKGLCFLNDPDVLQALKLEVMSGHSPLAQECIDSLEVLNAEDVIRDLFETYHSQPREIRMRLVLAAFSIDAKAFRPTLEQVLPLENEQDIASELILGLSGYGEWRMGLAALDRLESRRGSIEQSANLWMALGNLFSRRLKILPLMSAELREPGIVITRQGLLADERLLRAYLEDQPALFHDLAQTALQQLKPHLFACYDVAPEHQDTVTFLVDRILDYAQERGGRPARLVLTIILNEQTRFIADRSRNPER